MTLTQILGPALQASVALLVFSVGLQSSLYDATYLARQPRALLRSVLARNVVVPAIAVALTRLFELSPLMTGVILAVSIAAVPPILPMAQLRMGGSRPYVIGLLASQSVLAIVMIPLSLYVLDAVAGFGGHARASVVALQVFAVTLAPLVMGIAIHRLAPIGSERLARLAHGAAVVILVAGVFVILAGSYRAMWTLVGNGTVAALVILGILSLVAGHLFGGPRQEDRVSLALACTSSHPGLVLAILASTPASRGTVVAALLLNYVVQAIVTLPYKNHYKVESPTAYRLGGDRRRTPREGPERRPDRRREPRYVFRGM